MDPAFCCKKLEFSQHAARGLRAAPLLEMLPCVLLSRILHAQALTNHLGTCVQGEARPPGPFPPDDELAGTWEALSLDEEGRPLLERRDVWGFPDRPDSDTEPPRNWGIRFG